MGRISMEFEPPNTEKLIAVLACLESCRAYEVWRQSFAGKIERDDALYVYGEFLSDGKKRFATDLRYYDFEINKLEVLCGKESVLTHRERRLVNLFEAHLTSFGQTNADELAVLFAALKRTVDIRSRLKTELTKLIRVYAGREF